MEKELVIVGQFGRPHGLKGFVTINSFTEPRENVIKYLPWYVRKNNGWSLLNILHVETNNKTILAKIEGYTEREEVATLTNLKIGVEKEQLPVLQPGEYYWYQLIGLSVFNKENVLLGRVKEIVPTGSNDVLVVEGEKRYLIPYIQHRHLLAIDLSAGSITVDWDSDFA